MKHKVKMRIGRPVIPPIDFSICSQGDMARLFGVTPEAVSQWDCPRLPNKNYDAVAVVQWYANRIKAESVPSEKSDLEREKLGLQCQKLELEIEERKKNSIPLDEHKKNLAECLSILKDYFIGVGKMNLHQLANQPVEKLREYWIDLVKQAWNNFADNTK